MCVDAVDVTGATRHPLEDTSQASENTSSSGEPASEGDGPDPQTEHQ